MDILEIHNQAVEAAKKAEQDFYERNGEPAYCGFAWVRFIADGRSALAKQLKKIGAEKSWNYGYYIWNVTNNPTQSMDLKMAGAIAYVEVMQAFGIKVYAECRPD